jgi:uncharacterized surface protein with fasciclin (FAS1) repeats
MFRPRTLAAVIGIGAVAVVGAACGDDDDESTAAAPATTAATTAASTMEETGTDSGMATDAAAGTIVDVAAGNPDFSVLVEAVQAAGLAETLSGEGPFTVLAPTNAAFEQALGALGLTKEELLASESLAAILQYHVLAGNVGSADIAAEAGRETVQGEPVEIAADGGSVTINGSAAVVTPDVAASNGVIHVIDQVLLPPTVAEALGAGAESATTTG